jgi:hypothetical protein
VTNVESPKGRFVLTAALGFLLAAAPAGGYRQRVIFGMPAGDCTLQVEMDDDSGCLGLRVLPQSGGCRVAAHQMVSALKAAMGRIPASPSSGQACTSLFIGRLVDYPWLSEYLAETACQDPDWNRARGRPKNGDIHRYVAGVLSGTEVLARMQAAFDGSGYRVAGASVEKVLVGERAGRCGSAGRARPARVPFDAMVWFRLDKD